MISLLALTLALQGAVPPPPAAAAPPTTSAKGPELVRDPSPAERAWVASVVYRTVKEYFAHWSGLPPDYDFDAAYRRYLTEALAAPDRRSFSLATARLVAGLHNGHTGFTDMALYADARPPAFLAEPVDGRWTVTVSRTAGLSPGDVIATVDGAPVEAWVAPIRAVIGESSPRARDHLVFSRTFMLPVRMTLGLDDGRRISVSRDAPPAPVRGRVRPAEVTVTRRADGVVVVAIPGFDDPHFEADAVKAVRAAAGAPLIVLDVRGNGGGSTPQALLRAVMTAPYAGTVVSTPLITAEDDAHRSFDPDSARPATLLRYGPDVTAPDPGAYRGRMALLADGACASACEDLAIRFQSGRRGPVLGEATFGSTGQPIQMSFPELGMTLRVSTKRESFPDGSAFEGVGVRPDVPVPRTRADLAAPDDPVLERAVAAALRAPPSPAAGAAGLPQEAGSD